MAGTLDITQLRSFVAIADCGGFGRAATALHLSQPTVSQHVRSLERELGRALVEKQGRVMAFTAAGDRLLAEARRIISVHDEALARLAAPQQTTIVVGSTETAADQLLPELLSTLRAAYPERSLQFRIDRSTQMTDAVSRGAIDLAILLSTGPSPIGTEVGALPLNWYAAPDWRPPTDGSLPLVAYVEPCGMRQRALQTLGAQERQVEVVAESTTLEGVLAGARAGLGVAVLPSAGRVPAGLVVRDELPELGTIAVLLAGRKGIAPDVEATARDALDGFFAVRDLIDGAVGATGAAADASSDASVRDARDAVLPRVTPGVHRSVEPMESHPESSLDAFVYSDLR